MRSITLFLLLLLAAPAAADDGFTLRNGYYWRDGRAYTRTPTGHPCSSGRGTCYWYYPVPSYQSGGYAKKYPVYPVAGTTYNTKTYTYNLNYAQQAAPQGTTQYGIPLASVSLQQQGYQEVDLAATIDKAFRERESAMQTLSGGLNALAANEQQVAAYKHQENMRLLDIQETAIKAEALKTPPRASLQIQGGVQGYGASGGGDGGFAAPQGAAGWGPLVTQHCGGCHGPNGSDQGVFSLDQLLTFDGYVAAHGLITSDDPAVRMPKGVELDATARGALLNELSATVREYLRGLPAQ